MKAKPTRLDVDELLHLAIRASQENQHERTIDYLKQALDVDPKNAKALYLLGAEHAEIGLYDRAVEDMSKAVALDPDLVTATFQLGLLHITAGRVEAAAEAWRPLDKFGDTNPFFLFKTGMLHLVKDEFAECVASLEKGIALNTMNEALNNDMRRIAEEAKARVKEPPPKTPATGKKAGHVLLSAYRNEKDDKD